MKNPFNISALFALVATLAMPVAIHAQTITKADDTNSLDQGASWVGGTAPGSGNVAGWSGAYSGGPATGVVTNSLYAIFPASSALSWGGDQCRRLDGIVPDAKPDF